MTEPKSDLHIRNDLRDEFRAYRLDAINLLALYDDNPWRILVNQKGCIDKLRSIITGDVDECFGPSAYTLTLQSASKAGRIKRVKRSLPDKTKTSYETL